MSLQPSPKGHRRVKSLVREFDEIVKSPPLGSSPPISPDGALAPSSSSTTSTPSTSPGHVRRAASVSYSSSDSPGSSYFPSPFTSNNTSKAGAAFGSMRQSPDPLSHSGVGGGAHKRKGSVNSLPSLTTTARTNGGSPKKPMSLADELNGQMLGGVSEEEEDATRRAEEEEEQDVFLPLSPPSSSQPFQVKFTSATPTSPNFAPTPSTFNTSPTTQTHARSHSKIHERNLSAFFPRPGQQGVGYGDTYEDPNGSSSGVGGVSEVPNANVGDDDLKRSGGAGRRGHHHRHSLSHNFFSFMDHTETNGPLPNGSDLQPSPELYTPTSPNSRSTASYPTPSTPLSSAGASFLPIPSHAVNSKYTHLPTPIRFLVFALLYLPTTKKIALLISITQIVLGASLWILGQSGESLSVTGLGYLVVFDGMGGLSGVLVEGGAGVDVLWTLLRGTRVEKGVRLPFGTARLVTLSHFSQAIYLLFSAVYVCKESVEHVLLLHGGADEDGAHGSGHGGMGHGEGMGGSSSGGIDGITIPVFLLGLSALLSLVSAIAMRNHQTLTDAVGPSGLSFRTRNRSASPSLFDLVGNPFTLTVVAFCVGLVLASFTIPGPQLAPLDKVVALLQSIAMFYIAYPAAVATGQVLLQTAPPSHLGQMTSLQSGLRDIENHPLVVSVDPPHIWQLTPHPGGEEPSSSTSAPSRTRTKTADGATIIATLTVNLKNDVSDSDILSVTKFAQERCGSALGKDGEVSISVVRAKRVNAVNFYAAAGGAMAKEESGHGHSHEHSAGGHGHHH